MAAVHHRMPVILTPEQVGAWLDPASRRDDLQALLKPLPDEAVSLTPVSKRVNAVREDDAGLLEAGTLPDAPSQLHLFCAVQWLAEVTGRAVATTIPHPT